jgi:hypothetical protein
LVAVCAFALLCGTPLASAMTDRSLRLLDGNPPVITVPADITKPATSSDGAVVTFTVDYNDLDGDLAAHGCDHDSGETFPITTTTVTCTATDGAGNPAIPASFTITVTPQPPPPDTTAPNITTPADFAVEATSSAGALVTYLASADDPDDAVSSFGCSPASGTVFDLGPTTVTCIATDSHTNTASKSFTVSVVDTTGPVFGSVSSPLPTEATSISGASVSYSSPTATDAVTGTRPVDCSPASGSTFAITTTTVHCTASDGNGSSSSVDFSVTVRDTTPPTVGDPPADITREATSPGGVAVTFTKPGATDTVDGTVPVTCTPASGALFPVGTTTVDCTATDTHGNHATRSFHVTVQDTMPPVFGAAPDINADASPGGSTVVTFTKPTATDAVEGDRPVTCSPASGSAFPIGPTTVTCRASDSSGHEATKTFRVILTDRTPPVITVPADITAEATGLGGAAVTYAFSATDPDDAVSTSSCTPSSGATFAIGPTTVTCNATDSHSNRASKTFKVTVVDTTRPVLSNVPADKTVEANGFAGSIVDFTPPNAVDLGEPRLVTCAPARNSTFALGTTTVTCSASDGRGNTGTATFKVNVVDTTPPTLIPPGDTTVYATVDAGADPLDEGPISRFLGGYFVSDIADPHPLVGVDHPIFFVVGTTTVKWTATDASGNKSTVTAKLKVLPKPEPGTTPPALPPPTENTPPANPTGLTGKGGDRRATLKWTNPKNSDFAAVEIERGTNAAFSNANATGTVVYHGTGTSYVDKGLTNDVSYRYVVHSLDKNGNKSQGVAINITPRFQPLRTPADGARLATIPKKFVWTRDPKAAYYNFQLFLGGTLLLQSTTAEPRKIMSTWTTGPSLNFKSPWKWEGKSYKIAKGTYTWYVWPGYGARAAVNYGPPMGPATFQITKTPKPAQPKKKKK